MEPKSVGSGNTTPGQTHLPTEETAAKSASNVNATTIAPKIISHQEHTPSSERKSVADKITCLLDANDSASAIGLGAELNKTLLSDGVTKDERLVKTLSFNQQFTATNTTDSQDHNIVGSAENNVDDDDDDDDEFFDAPEDFTDMPDMSDSNATAEIAEHNITIETPQSETDSSANPTFASRILNVTKKLTGASKAYNYLLGLAESVLGRFITGIKGSDINELLVAMNTVHITGKPQELHLQNITLPFLDPSYQLSNAKIVLHEISVPDLASGYKHVRIKISVDADVQYPASDGSMVSGHIKLDNTTFDLNFEHEQFIKKLLTSANVVTTVAKTCGALLSSKIPGIGRFKGLIGWGQKTDSSGKAPTLKTLLVPNTIALSNVNLQTALTSNTDLVASFCVTADNLVYNPQESYYLCGQKVRASLAGNQCAKLLPFSLDDNLVRQLPFFHHSNTSTTIDVPQLAIKSEQDNQIITIPQAHVKTQGDIDIQNGNIEDLRLGMFTQPSGNQVTALQVGKITADDLHIPVQSFGVPVKEQGSIALEDVNMTVITSDKPADAANKNLLQEEGPTVLQRLKGLSWGWIYSNAKKAEDKQQAAEAEKQQKSRKTFTISANTVHGNLSGDINFAGQIDKLGLQISENDEVHLHTNKIEATKLNFSPEQAASFAETDEEPATPLNIAGTAHGLHLKVTPDIEQNKPPVTKVTIDQTALDIGGDIHAKNTCLKAVEVEITPSEQNTTQIQVNAKQGSCNLETGLLQAIECDADQLAVDVQLHQRPATEKEKTVAENDWQAPELVTSKVTIDIKSNTLTAKATTDVSAASPFSVDAAAIEQPVISLEINQPNPDAVNASATIQGEFKAKQANAKLHQKAAILEEKKHQITATCNELISQAPETLSNEITQLLQAQLKEFESSHFESDEISGQINISNPEVEFKQQADKLDAKTTLPEIHLDTKVKNINTQTTVHNAQAAYDSAAGTAQLDIRDITVDELNNPGVFECTSREEDKPLIHVDHIALQQTRHPETEETTARAEVGSVSANMDIAISDVQKIALQATIGETTLDNTHLPQSDKTEFYVAEVNVNIGQDDTLPVNVSLETEQFCAVAETTKEGNSVGCDAEKIAVHAKNKDGTIQSQVTLKDVGFNAQRTAEELKIQPHINNKESNIELNNLTTLVQQLNQQPTGESATPFPVRVNVSTHLNKDDELTGTVDGQCTGNIGEVVEYALPEMKSKKNKLLASCLKFATKLFSFDIQFRKLPVTAGRISISDLTSHLHVDISFRGRMAFVLRPAVMLVQGIFGIVVRKQLSALKESDIVDTEGKISLIKFLESHRIFFSRQLSADPFPALPDHFDLRQGWTHVRLHHSLPDEWNNQAYHKAVVLELEKLYGKNSELAGDFNQAATIITEKYDLPKTDADFNRVLNEINDIKKYKQQNPSKHTPLNFYENLHILKSDEMLQ